MRADSRGQAAAGDAVLRVRDLAVRFDSGRNVVHAVNGVSFDLEAGGALGDELVEALAGDVLHDDVGFMICIALGTACAAFGGGFADFVDGADVGVVDGGGEAGFAELGDAHLLGGEVAALEEFEDDGALEEGVVGKVDDAAAAGADLADELVLLDLASLHDFIIASVGVWMMKEERSSEAARTKWNFIAGSGQMT